MKGLTIKTAQDALDYIKSKGITPQAGVLYHIYTCGCVINREDDPRRRLKIRDKKGKSQLRRSCPNHKAQMLTRLRVCQCGRLYWGLKIKPAKWCKADDCHAAYQNYRYHTVLKKGDNYRNKHLRDTSRYDCQHRWECLEKYDKYDAVPCKGCKKYLPTGFREDINRQGGVPVNNYVMEDIALGMY